MQSQIKGGSPFRSGIIITIVFPVSSLVLMKIHEKRNNLLKFFSSTFPLGGMVGESSKIQIPLSSSHFTVKTFSAQIWHIGLQLQNTITDFFYLMKKWGKRVLLQL